MLRKEPNRWVLQLLIFIVYIPSLTMMIALILDHSDPETIRKELKLHFPSYKLSGLTTSGSADTLRFAPMFAIVHMTVLSTPIAIGILLLRRKIIEHLTYKGVDMTSKTRNLHAQLLRVSIFSSSIDRFFQITSRPWPCKPPSQYSIFSASPATSRVNSASGATQSSSFPSSPVSCLSPF